MNYEITNLTEKQIDTKLIENVIEETSNYLNVEESLVSIVLTDNKRIHEINKVYRNVDAPTDVISFAFQDEPLNPSSDLTNLGEIYISLEKASSQAQEYNHSFERELSFLTVHGLLHLLGYDHMNETDEKEMFDLQDKILKNLGIER